MLTRSVTSLVFLATVLLAQASLSSAEIYKYVNKDGVVSYTDSLQAVPDKYRTKATVVKGLREKEEKPADKAADSTASSAAKQEGPQAQKQQETLPVKKQIEKKVQDLKDKGYWKPILIILAFIAVFFLLGKASETLGHKGLWTILRLLVVLGLLVYFFYAYTREMSGVYSSLSDQVNTVKGTIDKKHARESSMEKEMFNDTKKSGDKK